MDTGDPETFSARGGRLIPLFVAFGVQEFSMRAHVCRVDVVTNLRQNGFSNRCVMKALAA